LIRIVQATVSLNMEFKPIKVPPRLRVKAHTGRKGAKLIKSRETNLVMEETKASRGRIISKVMRRNLMKIKGRNRREILPKERSVVISLGKILTTRMGKAQIKEGLPMINKIPQVMKGCKILQVIKGLRIRSPQGIKGPRILQLLYRIRQNHFKIQEVLRILQPLPKIKCQPKILQPPKILHPQAKTLLNNLFQPQTPRVKAPLFQPRPNRRTLRSHLRLHKDPRILHLRVLINLAKMNREMDQVI
jgi:hypothetical protein